MGRPKGAKDKVKRKPGSGSTAGNLEHFHGKNPNSNLRKTVEKTEKKEEISRIVHESVQYFPRKTVRTNEEMAERLNEYFRECYERGQIPTVEDMCLALGTNRKTLYWWENYDKNNRERAEMISQAKEVLAAIDAKLVSEGKIPQVTYIFRAKNYFGMRDQQDVIVTPNVDPLGDGIDAERLQKKYLESAMDEEITVEPLPLPAAVPADPGAEVSGPADPGPGPAEGAE